MKKLVIIRHAKAVIKKPSQSDFDRQLKKSSKIDAIETGNRLKELSVKPDLFLSSNAMRCKQTSLIIAQEISYPTFEIEFDSQFYESSVEKIIRKLSQLSNSIETVLMVGHNPELENLSRQLTNEKITALPTGSAILLNLNTSTWSEIEKSTLEVDHVILPTSKLKQKTEYKNMAKKSKPSVSKSYKEVEKQLKSLTKAVADLKKTADDAATAAKPAAKPAAKKAGKKAGKRGRPSAAKKAAAPASAKPAKKAGKRGRPAAAKKAAAPTAAKKAGKRGRPAAAKKAAAPAAAKPAKKAGKRGRPAAAKKAAAPAGTPAPAPATN